MLEINKLVMYEFWYDHMKLKYGGKAELCYTDTDNFLVYIKTNDIYVDTAEDVEARFDISNYESGRPLRKEKIQKLLD